MRGGAARIVAGLTLAGLATAPLAHAYPRPGVTEQVSLAPDGSPGTGADQNGCYSTSSVGCRVSVDVSADGRFVAFSSRFSDLVAGDTNGLFDVFVRDRATGTTERVSVASSGDQADGESGTPSLSADGRYVLFSSTATNLDPRDVAGESIYRHDRATGRTELVSIGPDGSAGAPGDASGAALSADGRWAVFSAGGFGGFYEREGVPFYVRFGGVYLRDLELGETVLVSRRPDGGDSAGIDTYASRPDVSGDGRFVVYESRKHDLTGDPDLNGNTDVFLYDRTTGRTELVSRTDGGERSNWASYDPTISDDGRFVAYYGYASNLVPSDTNGFAMRAGADVFVHDRASGRTQRVSVSASGLEADGDSTFSRISGDGRWVAFQTSARNLGADAPPWRRLLLYDRVTGGLEPVGLGPDGEPLAPSFTGTPALSSDGRFVAFGSTSSSSIFEDAAYLRDRGSAVGVGELSASSTDDGLLVRGSAYLAGVEITGASDPAGDAEIAREAGTDLTALSVDVRPEQEDVLVRLDVAVLPRVPAGAPGVSTYGSPPVAAGLPGTVHVVAFRVDGRPFEVRIARAGSGGAAPSFSLWDCGGDAAEPCVRSRALAGGYGTTGEELRVALELPAGARLTDVRARAGLGDAEAGMIDLHDELRAPDAVVAEPFVELAEGVRAELVRGRFSGLLSWSLAGPAPRVLKPRACVGSTCGTGELLSEHEPPAG